MSLYFTVKKQPNLIISTDREQKKVKKVNFDEEKDKLKEERRPLADDLAKGNENSLNAKLETKVESALRGGVQYDMSNKRRQMMMNRSDKVEMEKIRRWHVKINNIYITLKDKEVSMIDPFIQFTIGGNFCLNVLKNKKASKKEYNCKNKPVHISINRPIA